MEVQVCFNYTMVSFTNQGNVIMAVSHCWRRLEENEYTTFIARQQGTARPNPWQGPTRCRHNLGSWKHGKDRL